MKRYRRIRDLREDADLTQRQVGEAINVPQRTYAYYESGERMLPPHVLCALADFYGVSVDYLLERTDKKNENDRCCGRFFLLEMRRAQQCRLGRHHRNRIIRSRRNACQKCHRVDNPKRRGKAPPFWSLGVQGRDRNAPAVLLGDQKGAFSHVREGPLLLQTSRNASMR